MAYKADRVVKQFGKRIAELRKERGLSQGAFAAKLRSTPQWVSALERGTRSPTPVSVKTVVAFLLITYEAVSP